jgi:periplasmic divalent cation tolerance protein
MSEFLQVSTAAPSQEQGVALIQSAVKARLAGSGQVIGPVKSAYWHLGEFGEGEEYKVLLMTTADLYTELEQHLIKVHEWENPEITAVAIEQGSAAYLAWLRDPSAKPEES